MATTKGGSKSTGLSGQALKDFRKSVAVLKRKGIISKRVDARSQIDTRYMRAKVRKFNDVIEGRAIAIKAIPVVRRQYAESEALEVRSNRIIVPKEYEKQRASISRGMVKVTRPLRNGQEEYIVLPFKATNMRDLIERMIAEEGTIDALKKDDEFFSFRIGENNSQTPFINAKEMAEYLVKYSTRLDNPLRSGKDVRQLLTFQRFKVKDGNFERNPHESGKPKVPYPKPDATGRNTKNDNYYREKQAQRRRIMRANESPQARKRRLAANKIRSAQYRQRMFERD